MSAQDSANPRGGLASVAQTVRERDRDLYTSALFAPSASRADLLALYAFDLELQRIPSLVSEAMVGQIRLQWWRDAIDLAAPSARTGNPIADALGLAILNHALPKERLLDMVEARIFDLYSDPPADIAELKEYLENSQGAAFEMAAAILGTRSDAARKAASHAGLALGLTSILRSLPRQAAHRKLLLPASFLSSRGIDAESIFRGETTPSLKAGLADLRGAANRALNQFKALTPSIEKQAWAAFLPLANVKAYLKAMAAPDLDPLRDVVTLSPARRFWRIWRAAWRRTL